MCGPDESAADAAAIRKRVMNFTHNSEIKVEPFDMVLPDEDLRKKVAEIIQNSRRKTSRVVASSSGETDDKTEAMKVMSTVFSRGYYFKRVIFDSQEIGSLSREILSIAISDGVEVMFLNPEGKIIRPLKGTMELMGWVP